ncbi:hypothetical protein CkaCkLH20_09579 [Colletotrichum karsti]|uniref:Uncharacterized protein n=1 Tax=Colletotrichum karsti TaxID=1095194 RepID=A0A9P6HZ35_9PEZI|nr:uncharacterized protein CkaCkLH20_09579 [Colletotrichum karsti]KAF9873069.1 hypothetical protein CkaCkLH20_09579 [Colletotrichum karsti]
MKLQVAMTLGAQAASAALFSNWPAISAGPFGSDVDFRHNQSDEIYRKAITSPNATRSVKFHPFSNSLRGADGEPAEWTWRVNITEFSLPAGINITDIASENATYIENPTHVSTTYDFQWPGGGTLSKALGDSSAPFCISISNTIMYPANVTNLYTDEDTSSTDCEPVLGADCVRAILTKGDNFVGSSKTKCNGIGTAWSSLPECSGTLGYAVRENLDEKVLKLSNSQGILTVNINTNSDNAPKADSSAEMNQTYGITSGKGFSGFHSGVVSASEAASIYEASENSLQILMISHGFNSTGEAGKELLCMRVNTSRVADENGDGQNAGVRSECHVAWTMAIAGLTVLFACLI